MKTFTILTLLCPLLSAATCSGGSCDQDETSFVQVKQTVSFGSQRSDKEEADAVKSAGEQPLGSLGRLEGLPADLLSAGYSPSRRQLMSQEEALMDANGVSKDDLLEFLGPATSHPHQVLPVHRAPLHRAPLPVHSAGYGGAHMPLHRMPHARPQALAHAADLDGAGSDMEARMFNAKRVSEEREAAKYKANEDAQVKAYYLQQKAQEQREIQRRKNEELQEARTFQQQRAREALQAKAAQNMENADLVARKSHQDKELARLAVQRRQEESMAGRGYGGFMEGGLDGLGGDPMVTGMTVANTLAMGDGMMPGREEAIANAALNGGMGAPPDMALAGPMIGQRLRSDYY